MLSNYTIGVAIPCYRVKNNILKVIDSVEDFIDFIYVIDDKCPEESGKFVQENCTDKRVQVIFHEVNQGVGGAVKTGYKKALEDKCSIIVKLDGDGQMDPKLINSLIKPIIDGKADYVKGNRFYNVSDLKGMPKVRLFGNSVLSLINKFVHGYWHIMDPTNGFTAIHLASISRLNLDAISNRYFFESDMLYRLALIKAVVKDYPMKAVYADEQSSLRVGRILLDFPAKYLKRFFKRIFYLYFMRDINIGTLQLVSGSTLFLFGLIFGLIKWIEGVQTNQDATSGTVMLSALPLILGFQLLLSGLSYDMQNVPSEPLQKFDKLG